MKKENAKNIVQNLTDEDIVSFAQDVTNSLEYLKDEVENRGFSFTSHIISVAILSINDDVRHLVSDKVFSNFKKDI